MSGDRTDLPTDETSVDEFMGKMMPAAAHNLAGSACRFVALGAMP
jgi:hypothetical protein